VNAETLGERLKGFAAEHESVVKFVETWSADYLSEPLISTGWMSYKAPDQLSKTIDHPQHIVEKIDGDRLTITKDGKSHSVQLSDEPILAVGIYALRDVLIGSEADLQARFKLYYQEVSGGWVLQLVPRDDDIALQIKLITVRGVNSRINQISLRYQNGNSSITDISHDD
jgi:hypothetical protein